MPGVHVADHMLKGVSITTYMSRGGDAHTLQQALSRVVRCFSFVAVSVASTRLSSHT